MLRRLCGRLLGFEPPGPAVTGRLPVVESQRASVVDATIPVRGNRDGTQSPVRCPYLRRRWGVGSFGRPGFSGSRHRHKNAADRDERKKSSVHFILTGLGHRANLDLILNRTIHRIYKKSIPLEFDLISCTLYYMSVLDTRSGWVNRCCRSIIERSGTNRMMKGSSNAENNGDYPPRVGTHDHLYDH